MKIINVIHTGKTLFDGIGPTRQYQSNKVLAITYIDSRFMKIRGIIDTNINNKYNKHSSMDKNPFRQSESLNCSHFDTSVYLTKSRDK